MDYAKLIEDSKNEQLVKVYFGLERQPYFVPQSIVEFHAQGTTLPYEKPQTMSEGNVLRLLNDPVKASKAMLYYWYNGDMPTPSREDPEWLIFCWALGEKYNMFEFMNKAMSYLLRCINEKVNIEIIETAVSLTGPCTPMHKLMAESLIYLLHATERAQQGEIEEAEEKSLNFAGDVLSAQSSYEKEQISFFTRFGNKNKAKNRENDFMIPTR